jgi:TonB family protein
VRPRPVAIAMPVTICLALSCATGSQTSGPLADRRGATPCAGAVATDSATYDTTQVTERPRLRSGPLIQYPEAERTRHMQGRVIIAVTIDADGRVEQSSATIVRHVTPALDREAMDWVRRASYWPACRDTRPVRSRMAVPVDFRITSTFDVRRPGS